MKTQNKLNCSRDRGQLKRAKRRDQGGFTAQGSGSKGRNGVAELVPLQNPESLMEN